MKDTKCVHCTENSKHTIPEMKLRGLIPNFHIHVSGSNLYIPTCGLIWNLYFLVLRERTFGSTAGSVKRAGNCCPPLLGSSSLPSPLFLRFSESSHKCPRNKFPIWKITNHKWKQLVLATNFLFVLFWEWMRFQIKHLFWILTDFSFAVYEGYERDGTCHDLLRPKQW
jgi:hypothetical protein